MKKQMDLRYPIGQFVMPESIGKQHISSWKSVIAAFPEEISKEVSSLSNELLDTPYRTDGWTVRQVVHHCADSHINAYIRFKLALTETNPAIKPYFEASWAELSDSQMHVGPSLDILSGLHERWNSLLESLPEDELKRTYYHPEHERAFPLYEVLGMYAWHCQHHLAHIKLVTRRDAG